jgi:hypothetical protein
MSLLSNSQRWRAHAALLLMESAFHSLRNSVAQTPGARGPAFRPHHLLAPAALPYRKDIVKKMRAAHFFHNILSIHCTAEPRERL